MLKRWGVIFCLVIVSCACTKTPVIEEDVIPEKPYKTDVSAWITTPSRSLLLEKQQKEILFGNELMGQPIIEVNESITYQTIDGFGYTLTGGSASLINQLNTDVKEALLTELFGSTDKSIGVNYIRLSIGASDLSASTFTYNDLPAGETDVTLSKFNLDKEQTDLIPILKKIVSINPSIKIMGSPWTAPTWMKTNKAFKGGSLLPQYYNVYAQYFVKYIEAMKNEGILIDAITIQNEPLHDGNNPSMYMSASDQAVFIKNHLGPAFEHGGINTKIIIYDHNADNTDYPISILNDPEAKKYINGSAFHLYGGEINNLSKVHNAHPDKAIYFTEQWVGGPSNFGEDLKWHMTNLIIGATRNWSKNVLEWNLAANANYGPHTPGGCTTCLGALTITPEITKNVAYYIIGHASKFVPTGSVRIASNMIANLPNVAFRTPDGEKVLIVMNTSSEPQSFNLKFDNRSAGISIPAGSAGTFTW